MPFGHVVGFSGNLNDFNAICKRTVRALNLLLFNLFFFSSRRRHTRFDCDWSSDVCSSDLSNSGSPRLTQARGGRKQRGAVGSMKPRPVRVCATVSASARVLCHGTKVIEKVDRKSVV